MDEKMNNKAQVTIFIILGMILVVGMAAIFIAIKGPGIKTEDIENPQAYIDSCVMQFTEEAVNLLSEKGGEINPEGSTMFQGKNISYLCYNVNFYLPCIMQKPELTEDIEKEIAEYIKPKTENCFQMLKQKLESKSYNIEMGEMNLGVRLQPKKINIDIKREFKMDKIETTKIYTYFKAVISSPLYDFAKIAMEIANQEARYCNFDILGHMIFYPEFNLDKFRPGEGDVIYRITDLKTNEKFIFAIRSCALPPGF